MRAIHPESMRLQRHKPGETLLVPADGFGDGDRYVVRRTGDDRLDRIVDSDRFAGTEAELGRLLRRGISGDTNIAVEPQPPLFELFEQKIKRHHLGDRGWEAQLVFVAGIKRPAGIAVDNDCRDVRCAAAPARVAVAEWTPCDADGLRNGFAAKHGGGGANGGPRRAEQGSSPPPGPDRGLPRPRPFWCGKTSRKTSTSATSPVLGWQAPSARRRIILRGMLVRRGYRLVKAPVRSGGIALAVRK